MSSRYISKSLAVTVDGVTLVNTTDFSLDQTPIFYEHRGAGMIAPHLYLDQWFTWGGAFNVESDAASDLHSSLMLAADTATIVISDGGISRSLGDCWIWGAGWAGSRDGKPMKHFQFRRLGV